MTLGILKYEGLYHQDEKIKGLDNFKLISI